MKKHNNHVASKNPRLELKKTAVANLTLTDRQMANIMGGMVTLTTPPPVNSDNTFNGDPCTSRPTNFTTTTQLA